MIFFYKFMQYNYNNENNNFHVSLSGQFGKISNKCCKLSKYRYLIFLNLLFIKIICYNQNS